MNKYVFFVWSWTFIAVQASGQDTLSQHFAKTITVADLKENLTILASDVMEGRETGKRGQKMAAAFISAHYETLGLIPPVDSSYFQNFNLYTSVPGEAYIKSGTHVFKNFQEVAYYGSADSRGEIALEFVFAGKATPEEIALLELEGKGAIFMLEGNESYRSPAERLTAAGAKMVFVFVADQKEYEEYAWQFRSYTRNESLSLKKPLINTSPDGLFFISPEAAEKILNTSVKKLEAAAKGSANNALKKIPGARASYKTTTDIKVTRTENVLGYLEGTDKKDEVIVVTSHYDHIGKKEKGQGDLINNGADDDGSGTVAVMQLAKAFALAKKEGHGPRRSILFMNVTGEEKGLLGSEYYTQHPVFPLANTVVNLNIDMIGRSDPQHKAGPPYVYVIGSDKLSLELHNVNEKVNSSYTNLTLDYVYNSESHPDRLYYRSDHWNFAKRNIPVIFYFDGIHEDYHKPSDEVEKIEFDLLAKRTQLVFYTAWEIANRDKRIVPDKATNKN